MTARMRLRAEVRRPHPARLGQSTEVAPAHPRASRPIVWEETGPRQQETEAGPGHLFSNLVIQSSIAPSTDDNPQPRTDTTDELQDRIRHITDQSGTALPHRAELEALLGKPLKGIEVYSNAETRQLLEELGARAAVHDGKLLLAEADPSLDVLLHEAVHLLQGSQANGNEESVSGVKVIPLDSPIEKEARRVEQYLTDPSALNQETGGTPALQVENDLAQGEIALQRTTSPGMSPLEVMDRPRRPGLESWVVAPTVAPEERFERELEASQAAESANARREPSVPDSFTPGPETESASEMADTPSGPSTPAETSAETSLAPAETPTATTPDVAAQEQARAQAEAALQGVEETAGLMNAYAAAPPTVKARQAAGLSQRAGELNQQEMRTLEESVPEFHAELNTQVEAVPPLQVASPPTREITLEETPPAPAVLPELPPTPNPGHYAVNDNIVRSLESGLVTEGGNPSAEIGESLGNVRTTDPEILRSPGPPPAIPLEGETDPSRLEEQTANSLEQGQQVRAEARQAVLDGPGPEQVQPLAMDEVMAMGALERPVLESPPAAEAQPGDGPEAYLAMDLPPEVQAQFDQDQQGAMQASMQEAQTQVGQAAGERDRQRQERVEEAEAESRRLSEDADAEQRQGVQSTRQEIQDERQSTINRQNEEVENLERDAENRRQEDRTEINGRVSDDQGRIEGRYDQAEEEANRRIQEGERQAEQRREQAEHEAGEQSWWERAVNFVRDAFNALVSAIGAIFDLVRDAVNAVLDAAKAFAESVISAVADFIKSAIAAFGEFLKVLVDALLGDIFPGLAAALNEFIDEAVQAAQSAVDAVAEVLKNAVNALVEGLRAGLNAIINTFQAGLQLGLALVEAALTGDWSGLALKVLESVLRIVGVNPDDFYAFVGRARVTIQIIVDDPGAFVGHLIDAFLGGVRLFGEHFLTHLQTAIIEWLTGVLGGAGITLPERFDLMGALSLVQQILGLTWDRLRQKAVRLIGERNVAVLEHIYSYIETLVTGGWPALFERIVQDLSGLVDTVLEGIRNFLVERIVMAAITRLALLFNPVGAIVQLVMAAWNIYTFLRDQLARIIQVVRTVVDAIGNIARGVIDPASQTVESVLGRLLTFAIDLLARFLNLGGISARVREIIETVRARVDQAIDRLLERVRNAFRPGRGAEGRRTEGEAPPAGGTADIQDVARTSLLQRLAGDHEREEVAVLARQIQDELRPQGLLRIELGAPDPEGAFEIFTEASPRRRATRLVPKRTRGRVIMNVRMELTGEEPAFPAFPSVPGTLSSRELRRNETGEMEDVTPGVFFKPVDRHVIGSSGMPSRYRDPLSRSGGVVHRPSVDRPNEVRTSSWNTGENPDPRSNHTHAERQFREWVGRQQPVFLSRVNKVQVDINKSPCKLCSRSMADVLSLAPQVSFARLHFDESYQTPPNATTLSSLERMGNKWNVSGPSRGPHPPASDEHDLQYEIENNRR